MAQMWQDPVAPRCDGVLLPVRVIRLPARSTSDSWPGVAAVVGVRAPDRSAGQAPLATWAASATGRRTRMRIAAMTSIAATFIVAVTFGARFLPTPVVTTKAPGLLRGSQYRTFVLY
jgi:hypothetical protein